MTAVPGRLAVAQRFLGALRSGPLAVRSFRLLAGGQFLTVLQRCVPPALLGRVMGMLMFCAFGTFPLSVAVAGVLVHHLGPVLFFPVAGGPSRGGHPGRADAAGVPDVRGP